MWGRQECPLSASGSGKEEASRMVRESWVRRHRELELLEPEMATLFDRPYMYCRDGIMGLSQRGEKMAV